jgi:hypothetical protein
MKSVEHKHEKEKMLSEVTNLVSHPVSMLTTSKNLLKISKRLPRIDLYNELYATDRMAGFVSTLYASVMKFMWEMFVYFKKSTRGISEFFAHSTILRVCF